MDTSNDSEKGNIQDHLKDMEHGNDTYGHSDVPFKRKDEPDDHLKDILKDREAKNLENAQKLKNINLSSSEDIGTRNADLDKGLGGKNL